MSRNKKLLNESLEAQSDNLIIQRAREHLIDFSIATNPKYDPNWHHEIIADELEKASRDEVDWKILILMMPPRHGKSEEATVNFPAWYLGNFPDKEIITASYSAELAQDFGGKTRQLVDSQEYQAIFNLRLKEDEKSKAKWKTQAGGSYTSVGIGGALTGRGANCLIIDDPLKNREEADSKLIRDKHWDWFLSTAYTRLEPNGKVIIILTRWHLDDLAGRILLNEELKTKTKVIKFPAIAIEDEKYRKAGEALWPSRYSLEELQSIKAADTGTLMWSALYQQEPILSESQEFKPHWILTRPLEKIDEIQTRNFLTIDTAISQKSSGDYTGICRNYVDRENKWNLWAYRMKIDPKELIDLLFKLHEEDGYEKIGIEKTVYADAIKPFLDEEMRKRNKFLPIVELLHNQIAKETRIRGLIPRYESKSIFHLEGRCKDLEEEMWQFPLGVHDDILDSLAYQLQIAEAPLSGDRSEDVQANRNAYGFKE
jgi:hypothetical protein